MMVKPATRNPYRYNPDCACLICANNGQIPENHPNSGHSFCYGLEHVPPVQRPPWA